MSNSFVGSVVSIDCGDVLGTYQGQVYSVEGKDNTLSIIKCYRNGIQCQVPKVTLCATDILNLQILKTAAEAGTMPEIRQKHMPNLGKAEFPEGSVAPARASSADLNREEQSSPVEGPQPNKTHRSRSVHENYQRTSPVKTLYSDSSNGNRTPRGKQGDYSTQNGYHNHGGNNRRTPPQCYENGIGQGEHGSRSHEYRHRNGSTPRKMDRRYPQQKQEDWFSAPVDSFLDDDFDFEKNLALFDKKAVFKEIENNFDYNNMVNNTTDKKPTKYRHDENVLESGPVVYRQIKLQPGIINGVSNEEYVTDSGLIVPCISYESRSKLMNIAENYGLTKARQLEMIGRSASEMVLQLLGGSHRLGPQNAHQKPVAVVLCGPHMQGAMGVNCARQLAIHNVQVIVFVPNFIKVIKELEDELQLYDLSGGSKTSNIKELPSGNIDMIINAMDNHENRHLLSGQPWYKSIVDWANQNRAAVLALDPPTGGGAIDTKWSLSIGLPLNLSERCGQVYLCDLGIPIQVFQETGITYKSPFVHKFLIPLHARHT